MKTSYRFITIEASYSSAKKYSTLIEDVAKWILPLIFGMILVHFKIIMFQIIAADGWR